MFKLAIPSKFSSNLLSNKFIIRIIEMKEIILEAETMIITLGNQTVSEEILTVKIVTEEVMEAEEETVTEILEAAMTDQILQTTEISQKDPSSAQVYLQLGPAVTSMTLVTWELRPRATRQMSPSIRA